MAQQTVHQVNHPGYDMTANAVAADGVNGDKWLNSGGQLVAINNGSGSAITVTLNYTTQFDGATPANKTLTIPAGHTAIVGPFSQAYYNDANGYASISYSSAASVTILVFQQGS